MTEEQTIQSQKNFLRLILSIVHQTEAELPDVIDSALTAIMGLIVDDIGREATAEYLRTLADSLTTENASGLDDSPLH